MQRATFITFATAFALSALHPAYAGETGAVPTARSERVTLAGIDTSTQRGADQTLERIHRAAADVCEVRTGIQPLAELRDEQQCARDTMNQSVTQLADANVSTRYAELTNGQATQFASR